MTGVLRRRLFVLAAVAASIAVLSAAGQREPVTFNKDVAPIIFEHCSTCHRPGEVGPFNLLTYEDARLRARLIADATEQRFMPPWMPEPGHGEFEGDRRLDQQPVAVGHI